MHNTLWMGVGNHVSPCSYNGACRCSPFNERSKPKDEASFNNSAFRQHTLLKPFRVEHSNDHEVLKVSVHKGSQEAWQAFQYFGLHNIHVNG
jgi:hypothetical protein